MSVASIIFLIFILVVMIRIGMQWLYSHENSKKSEILLLGMVVLYMIIMQCTLYLVYIWQVDVGSDLRTCYEYMAVGMFGFNLAALFTIVVNYIVLRKKK